MAGFPSDADLFGNLQLKGSAANALMKTWCDVTRELPGALPTQNVTISNDVITLLDGTSSDIVVDTEGGAQADDIRVIAGSFHDGALIRLRSANASRAVTLKKNTGVGGVNMASDIVLATDAYVEIRKGGNNWYLSKISGASVDVVHATTTNAGIVKLDNTLTSTSVVEAATANAVKAAYDRGTEGVNSAKNKMEKDFSNAIGLAPDSIKWSGAQIQYGGQQTTPGYVLGWNGMHPPYILPYDIRNFNPPGLYYESKQYPGFVQVSNAVDANSASLYFRSFNNYGAEVLLFVSRTGMRYFSPTHSGILLGGGSGIWDAVHASSGTIVVSDANLKQLVGNEGVVSESVLAAWARVGFVQYQLRDAIAIKAEKGDVARIHTGLIAQRIKAEFEAEGLDPFAYGLLCHDEWEAQEEIAETYTDADGKEHIHIVHEAREAGNRYALRYEECLCLEAAYQRWRADKAENRLSKVEDRLAVIEKMIGTK